MFKCLVTGSPGLIGSEVCAYFAARGFHVYGVDNNQRAVFFGPSGDTRWNQQRLEKTLSRFQHHELDIRDLGSVRACRVVDRPEADPITKVYLSSARDPESVLRIE